MIRLRHDKHWAPGYSRPTSIEDFDVVTMAGWQNLIRRCRHSHIGKCYPPHLTHLPSVRTVPVIIPSSLFPDLIAHSPSTPSPSLRTSLVHQVLAHIPNVLVRFRRFLPNKLLVLAHYPAASIDILSWNMPLSLEELTKSPLSRSSVLPAYFSAT